MLRTKDGLDLFTQSWRIENPKAILVFTHGHGEHAKKYGHVAQAMNDGGYSFYLYEMRGQGRSGGPRGHIPNYESLLDDLQLAFDWARNENDGKRIFLGGHSTGGQITLNFAIRRKPPAAGVLVTGPWLRLMIATSWWKRIALRSLALVWPTFAVPKDTIAIKMSHDDAFMASIRDDKLRVATISARMVTELIRWGGRALDHAVELEIPVLLMHGGEDKMIDPAPTQTFYDRLRIADKTLHYYGGMYHEILNEVDRAVVFKDILEWLNQHTST